jgi:methyltransferase (TIGR00027 family)
LDRETDKLTVAAPESTAVRVALWRALHVECDDPPHVLEDTIGLRLVEPDSGWRKRPDMDPEFTRPFRASIVARARFIEDLVIEQAGLGVNQYVILGAGLDTYAQRQNELASNLKIFEIDRSSPQSWKRQRLMELNFGVPSWLHLVSVDFESGESWLDKIVASGFDTSKPAVITSTGVSMYLTKAATDSTFRQVAALARGTTLAMTFLLPLRMADPEIRPGLELAEKGARASGTPFISFYTPDEIIESAQAAGFTNVQHISADVLTQRYFSNRNDGLRPPRNAEELLVASN